MSKTNRPADAMAFLLVVLLTTLAMIFSPVSHAVGPGEISSGLWALPPDTKMTRWLEIHLLDAEGLYHVQVMGRMRGDPVWKYVHLVDHLAITDVALRASIVRRLSSGSMYPESYIAGYRTWLKARARGSAFVCTTTVMECLANSASGSRLPRRSADKQEMGEVR